MLHRVLLSRAAQEDLDALRKLEQTAVMDAIAHFLAHEPRKESRSRIKRLRGRQAADYRLRIGRLRVFYTVDAAEVFVLRVMSKEQTAEFYREEGP